MRRRSIWSAVTVLTASLLAIEIPHAVVQAATVPAGFTDVTLAAVNRPTAVEWLPNDRVVVLEQGGRIRIGAPGAGMTTALTITNLCSNGERGLLGFTHDPAFLGNRQVYVYYTRSAPGAPGGCVNRVSRFSMSQGDRIDPASEVVLLDNISSINGNHNGGDVDFGSDGFLYVSVGDAGRDPRGDSGSAGSNDAAQDRSLLNGKILRVTRTGQPAPGNPLSGSGTARCATRGNTATTPTTRCQEIFAWGLRNPFRIAFDRNDGSSRFFINDVGQQTMEEVDEGVIGANYGWPIREGSCPQGQLPPCSSASAGLIDPLTAYTRDLGRYVTGGAFTPNGQWPAAYDGTYLFADGGSGRIWVRRPNGSVDYGAPFASGLEGIVDMTFGYDAAGRMVLYYVRTTGQLGAITPTTQATPAPTTGMRMIPVTPFRAYDTNGVGVAAGRVVNGTTRLVDLDPPGAYEAALVNITYAATVGPGFVRTWQSRTTRPATSSLNADQPGAFVANAAIVPLAPDGTFVLESSTTARIVVDVMAWLDRTGGTATAGRFVALGPARLADTRLPAGTALDSGSPNPWSRTGTRIDVTVAGHVGVPTGTAARAVVISIATIAGDGSAGFVGAFPAGSAWPGNSNVNVVRGDIRANLVVVPIGTAGQVSLATLNVANVVVDVLGYVTSASAPASASGLYSAIAPRRLVDTRAGVGFPRPGGNQVSTLALGTVGAAIVQNVTVTKTTGAGYVATYPFGGAVPTVSTVNYTAPGQTRAALAFTPLGRRGAQDAVSYTTLRPADLVIDAIGYFSR